MKVKPLVEAHDEEARRWRATKMSGPMGTSYAHAPSRGLTAPPASHSPLALLEKLAAFVPLPRVHLVCYAGCLAPQSKLRDTIIPTPRQQGVDEEEAQTGTPS